MGTVATLGHAIAVDSEARSFLLTPAGVKWASRRVYIAARAEWASRA
jgi:hypothetical protein